MQPISPLPAFACTIRVGDTWRFKHGDFLIRIEEIDDLNSEVTYRRIDDGQVVDPPVTISQKDLCRCYCFSVYDSVWGNL